MKQHEIRRKVQNKINDRIWFQTINRTKPQLYRQISDEIWGNKKWDEIVGQINNQIWFQLNEQINNELRKS